MVDVLRVSFPEKGKRVETKGKREEIVVVLDLGDGIMAFDESHHEHYEEGGVVEGTIGLGIDPFFYKEGLCLRPGIPALIYSWKIEKIEMLMAPWLETWEVAPHLKRYVKLHPEKEEESKRKVFYRDKMKISYKEIERTDAWHDGEDHHSSSYLLNVNKIPTPPASAIGGN